MTKSQLQFKLSQLKLLLLRMKKKLKIVSVTIGYSILDSYFLLIRNNEMVPPVQEKAPILPT